MHGLVSGCERKGLCLLVNRPSMWFVRAYSTILALTWMLLTHSQLEELSSE